MTDLDLELLASIASGGLGSWQQDAQGRSLYVKSDDCIGCLCDLQRFFRYDDPEGRPAFFALSKYNFARSDLVPLIVTYPDDYDVVYNALKVATYLTMPSSKPLVTTNKAKQDEHMQAVCEAFLAQDALATVVGMLAEPLSRHPNMDERDAALVQLVIAFFKNLVAIPEAPAGAAAGGATRALSSKDARRRIQNGLLERLFADNVMDLLLLLAQHSQQRPFRGNAPVLVEIFMHIFCSLEPQQLLDSPHLLEAQQRRHHEEQTAALATVDKKQRHTQQQQQQQARKDGAGGCTGSRPPVVNMSHLARLPALPLQRPFAPKSIMPRHVAQAAPARHAHSGAVYVRRHSEHSSNIVLRHNPHRSELPHLPAVVDAKKAPSQRKDGQGPGGVAGGKAGAAAALKLSAELLARLEQFLQQFLEGAYDLLMTQVFRELQPGLNISHLSDTDFLHFVRLSTYCTRYVRLKEERKLQSKLRKEKARQAGSVEAAPGSAAASGAQGEEQVEEEEEASPFSAISATMGWDCFHWLTLLWIMLSNMEGGGRQMDHNDKNWDLQHASVPLLKEMLLALDLARVAGNAADRRVADRLQRRLLHDDLKESGLLPVLSRLIKGYNFRFQPRSHAVDLVETLHVVLGMLDRLSAAEHGEFRVKAAARQGAGRRRKPTAIVSPTEKQPAAGKGEGEGTAGAGDETAEAAGEAQAAHRQAGGEGSTGEQQGSPAGGAASAERWEGGEADGDNELAHRVGRSGDPLDGDVFDEPQRTITREVAFEAARRVRQECAQPIIVHFYAWLLQGYRTNALFTNHAILSFFRRIAEPHQLNLEPMLYQLSLLRLFEAILSDLAIKRNPDFAKLLAFVKGIVRSLFARMVPDLSELRQKSGQVGADLHTRFAAANGVAASAVPGSNNEQEADSAEQATRKEWRLALAEIKAQENASAALFMELLFWKGANVAEDVCNGYNWRGLIDPQEHMRRGRRHGRSSALGKDEGSDGEGQGQRFFPSFRKKELFSEEQAASLRSEFERCNGRRDCLDALVFEFGGQWKKGQISRQLKVMGLVKGKFTEGQETRMRERYEEVQGKLDCFELIAEELDAGFTANQIKRHLRKIGVVAGRDGGSAVSAEQEARMRDLYDELMACKDCFKMIAEELGGSWTSRKVKRHLQKTGVVPRPNRRDRKRDATFDALVAGSSQRGSPGSRSRGGSGSDSSLGSDSDGSNSGFGSAKSELEEGSDGRDGTGSGGGEGGAKAGTTAGGSRAKGRAARRTAALEQLQKGKGLRKKQQRREMCLELGGAALESEDEREDHSGDVIAAQQAAAAVAGVAFPVSSAGGSFLSLLDSDAEGEVAATDVEAPTAAKPRQEAAAAATAGDSDLQVSSSSGKGDCGSDSSFGSALESNPEAEEAAEVPVKRQKRQAPAPKQKQGKKQWPADSPSQPRRQEKKAQPQQNQAQQRQQQGACNGSGMPDGKQAKRKAQQQRAALEALKRRKQQGACSAGWASLPLTTETLVEWREKEAAEAKHVSSPMGGGSENVEPQEQQQAVGKAGRRRRIQRAGGSGGGAFAAAGLEDLEDDI